MRNDGASDRDWKKDRNWSKKGRYTSDDRAASSVGSVIPGSSYDSEDRVEEYPSGKHKYASVVLVSAGITTFESGVYSLKKISRYKTS